jgi:type II secretory pathway component PulC
LFITVQEAAAWILAQNLGFTIFAAIVFATTGGYMLPKLSALVAACLLVLVGWGWQLWDLRAVYRGDFIDDSQLKIKATKSREGGMGLEQIAALHLFGNPADKIAAAPVVTDLPKTDLKLVLMGAITDSNSQKASALIDADRQTRRYFIGDSIPGGAVLHEVLSDSVVLKRDNRYETLAFPKGADINSQAKTPVSNMNTKGGAVSAPGVEPAPVPVTNPAGGSRPTGQSPTQGLTLRERLQNTPRPAQRPPDQK